METITVKAYVPSFTGEMSVADKEDPTITKIHSVYCITALAETTLTIPKHSIVYQREVFVKELEEELPEYEKVLAEHSEGYRVYELVTDGGYVFLTKEKVL